MSEKKDWMLFWGCFIALVATAFGFVIRVQVIGDWGAEFNLSETQKGEILGVGLWPFALSIILFSLIIDRVGYGRAMVFAFVCHVVSVIITVSAKGYWALYIGTFIAALGNGTVEAVINPVIATMFKREKTKWLNILHAGWPGGIVLCGILALLLGNLSWQWKVGLILIPTFIYAVMLWKRSFGVNERVLAGVSYKEMLQQMGIIGAALAVFLIVAEMGRVFALPVLWQWVIGGVIVASYGVYTKSFGQWIFILLLFLMIPLATTELGTDAWIKELMGPVTEAAFGLDAGWILVYTASIMMILRLICGPIVKRLGPLGMLALSSLFAAAGLCWLSNAQGIIVLFAATIYGIGQTFFWPTTLGLVSEQFPKGGALAINSIAGIGMLGVGIIGATLLGHMQDKSIDSLLMQKHPLIYKQVMSQPKESIFGSYQAIDRVRLNKLSKETIQKVTVIQGGSKKYALRTVAILPIIMFVCYVSLMLYFRSRGGYRAVMLE